MDVGLGVLQAVHGVGRGAATEGHHLVTPPGGLGDDVRTGVPGASENEDLHDALIHRSGPEYSRRGLPRALRPGWPGAGLTPGGSTACSWLHCESVRSGYGGPGTALQNAETSRTFWRRTWLCATRRPSSSRVISTFQICWVRPRWTGVATACRVPEVVAFRKLVMLVRPTAPAMPWACAQVAAPVDATVSDSVQ